MSTEEKTFSNRAFPYTLSAFGLLFGLLWLATALILQLRLNQNPFLFWANAASRTTTLVGLTWALFVVPFLAWLVVWVNAPRQIIIGPDFVEGSPPRLRGRPPARRRVVIRFEVLGRVGWTLLGPVVQGNRMASRGSMLLLSPRNAKIIRQRWDQWKRERDGAPFTDLPVAP